MITGISGGSFTALAYGLYGEKLFDITKRRFLKRNVQGELIRLIPEPGPLGLAVLRRPRAFGIRSPTSTILFNGATFDDLQNAGPDRLVVASATDIATASRVVFTAAQFRRPVHGPSAPSACRARPPRRRRRCRSCCRRSPSTTTAAPAATENRRGDSLRRPPSRRARRGVC